MYRLLVATLLLLVTSQAHAWSEAGHRITGSIAFRQLTPDQQAQIVAILKQHPRFAEDFKAKMPDGLDDKEQNEFMFQQTAVWPDIARGFKGENKKYHHSTWHYINLPMFLTNEDRKLSPNVNVSLDPPDKQQEEMNVVQTIRFARRALADRSVPDAKKAIWLCWLFHCVGDLHQPLHSTALFSTKHFPEGDRGGNSVKTEQKKNLHALWDQFLGNKAQYRTARNKAIVFVNQQAAIGQAAVKKLDEKAWLDESFAIADTAVYDNEVRGHLRVDGELPELKLTERYLEEGGRIAERRVIEAGFRLGAVLGTLPN